MSTLNVTTRIGPVAVRQSSGSGLPIVMLHGIGLSGAVFEPQFASPLARIFRLVAIDLPGHGASADSVQPDRDYTIAANADLVVEVMRALGFPRALVMGWSLGGHIALEIMGRYADMLAGVMACGTAPLGRGFLAGLRAFQWRTDLLLASKAHYSRADAERFASLCFGDMATPEHVQTIMRANGPMRPRMNRSLAQGEGVEQRAVIESSLVPLAMVNGAEDPIVRGGYIAGLGYANLWADTCHVIEGAGHAPFYTATHAFNALLHRFATEMELRSGTRPRRAEDAFSRVRVA